MRRYKKIVFETENGITFEVSEGTRNELIIKATKEIANNVYLRLPNVLAGEYAKFLSVYTDKDGNKAIVPPGWTVSGAKSENNIFGSNEGLVIYQIPKKKAIGIDWTNEKIVRKLQKKYNQFTWVPVEKLDANSIIDDSHYAEKFGRVDYSNEEFSDIKFHEDLTGELLEQCDSVKKYGGFYISRYNISKSSKGKPQSVRGAMPWVNIDFHNAKKIASLITSSELVKSHLSFGAEYDSVLKWFIKSRARTREEIVEDSTKWGNYFNTENSTQALIQTGSNEKWCTNNIYDLAGNVCEWTQEIYNSSFHVIRGGFFNIFGNVSPVAFRRYRNMEFKSKEIGFRSALYIK